MAELINSTEYQSLEGENKKSIAFGIRNSDCYKASKYSLNIPDDPTSTHIFLIRALHWDYTWKKFQELTMINTMFCKLLSLSL